MSHGRALRSGQHLAHSRRAEVSEVEEEPKDHYQAGATRRQERARIKSRPSPGRSLDNGAGPARGSRLVRPAQPQAERRPNQLPNVADYPEGESRGNRKAQGSEDRRLATLLGADLGRHHEQDTVDGDRECLNHERHANTYRQADEMADPIRLEGAPGIRDQEQKRRKDTTSRVPNDEGAEDGDNSGKSGVGG